jgi:ketosteroid isomerase-like protein
MATKSTDDTTRAIRTVIKAFDDRNFDAMAAVHADDVVLHENGTTYTGYDAVEEHMGAALDALGDAAFTVDQLVTEGDTVACQYTITATVDDQAVEGGALALARVEDGLIREVHVQSTAPVDETVTVPTMEAANVALVRSLYEAADGGEFDAEAFFTPLAEDVEWIEPAGSPVGGTHRGHEGVGAIMETMGSDFESFEMVPDRFIADGATVAVPVTERFVLPDGEAVEVRALHLYDIENGSIVRMENFEDTARLT